MAKRRTEERQGRRAGEHPRGHCLADTHVEFVCREIAEFRALPASRLVAACVAAFLGFPPVGATGKRRHWWADQLCRHFPRDRNGNVLDACRHRERITALRDMWREQSQDALLIANRRGRLEMLQRCHDASFRRHEFRDAAYILSLAEREMGEAERHGRQQFDVDFVLDEQKGDTPPALPAPA